MFDAKFITTAINRSAETALDRRKFFAMAGVAGAGVAGSMLLDGTAANAAVTPADTSPISDATIFNFALNLEYLEAEFYSNAVYGHGLPNSLTHGTGNRGPVTGGAAVPFQTPTIQKFAKEIAADEKAHVAFLRNVLGTSAVARPAISLDASFTAAATAAGVIKPGQVFDPYANEVNFLFAAFLFEDVGVTAYKGAAPLISNKAYLEAAAGILSVEAYHAGLIRSTLYGLGVETPAIYHIVQQLSDARDSLDGPTDDDQGIGTRNVANIVPTDANAITYSRTPGQVLNIVYLNPNSVVCGGFFPNGVNGALNTSGANG